MGCPMFRGMDFTDYAAAVALGNFVSVSMLWGLYHLCKKDRDPDVGSLPFYAFILPVGFIILAFISTGSLPGTLGVLASGQ